MGRVQKEMTKFYKGVLVTDLKPGYVPGTVTTVFNEALMWKERISGKKTKGASKHIRHGQSQIVEIAYTGDLLDHTHFQKEGVCEHSRPNCWTSAAKTKAQINTPCQYRVLSNSEINQLFNL